MSKKIVSFVGVIALVVCVLVTFYLLVDNNKDNDEDENKVVITDAIKFSKEYTGVQEKNIFVYKTADEVVKILENGTGIVFMGFAACPWCQAYAPILNDVAMDIGIDKIFYCDIREDRANETEAYKKIVSLLGNNLQYDDEGNHRVYVPDVSVVVNGEIMGHDNETSLINDSTLTPEAYWTDEKKNELRLKLEELIDPLVDDSCTKCE
jgi:hypothetical protein